MYSVGLLWIVSRGRKSDAKLGAIDVFVMDCDQSKIMVESGDMITIHPVLQYYDVIARDMPLIDVIVRKIGGLQVSWWISRANTYTGIGSKSTDSRLIAGLATILGQL